MEVDAVLEALVFEADEGDAGVFGAALGFEVFEEGGSVDSEGDVAESTFFGEFGLLHFFFQKDLLFCEGAIGSDGGFDFAEGEEGDAGIVFDSGAIAIEGSAGAGGEGASLINGLSEGGGNAVDEVVRIEGATDVNGSVGRSAGKTERGEEVFAGGLGSLRGSKEVSARGDEIGTPLYELGWETDGDFSREKGEVGGG